ncbi:DUF305 domain-containing protein [Amycolatopsis sp. lyj-346]|uniref:DUF305 domain-containing protein n=1 Tax=Amycolatopsis sp. lyj-346 TaxID=2789289 RepID=UPI00397D3102
MTTEAGLDTEEVTEQPTWSRWVIIGGTLLAVLLLGATAGMFLTRAVDEPAAATPAAGSVEVGFAQDMSTHHLQAVTMAGIARDRSTDPEIEQLSFDIERTQLEQVGRMKGWLMLWDQPEQPIGAPMQWMTEPMPGHDGMSMTPSSVNPAGGPLMPGMATDTELKKLRSLSGRAFDVYFLQLMLRHHEGGTSMAQYAAAHSSLPALKALVNSILTSQGAEMDQIKLMLSGRGAQPL